jgi:tetratricopeptide (TPR) repeat protein
MSRVSVASLVVASALFAATAAAESDAASRAKARELTERAIEKMKAGEHEAAIELYLRAYELSSEAILLSNIGSAYQSLGRRERALRYFCRYLEAEPGGKLAGFARDQANQLSTDLGNRTAACEKPAARPVTPVPGDGGAGDPVSPAGAGLGESAGEPSSGPDLSASASVEPSPSREPSLAAPLRIGGLALTGAGVVGLGVGGYYGYVGKRASDRITNNRDAWTQEDFDQQQIGKDANANMKVALIAGGAAVVTGVALYFWGRSMRVEERRVSVAPQLSPESSGLAISGAF